MLLLDEEVFSYSDLDMTDAPVWTRPALISTKRKTSIAQTEVIHKYFK